MRRTHFITLRFFYSVENSFHFQHTTLCTIFLPFSWGTKIVHPILIRKNVQNKIFSMFSGSKIMPNYSFSYGNSLWNELIFMYAKNVEIIYKFPNIFGFFFKEKLCQFEICFIFLHRNWSVFFNSNFSSAFLQKKNQTFLHKWRRK